MRRPIIAGNWKMNKTTAESVSLVDELKALLKDKKDVEVVVCPPYTALFKSAQALQGSNIKLGAQDMHWEPSGAYTGEISSPMLKDIGCQYVIIGHSERRQYFGETNESVNKKVKAALKAGITPIMCVGEKLEEREKGLTEKIIEGHLRGGFDGLSKEDAAKIVVAYEPVWAIGTGKTATPAQAQEVHSFIRNWLKNSFGDDVASKIIIQYGGSVTPDNIEGLMKENDVDGALVGGASLKADSFSKIVKGSKVK